GILRIRGWRVSKLTRGRVRKRDHLVREMMRAFCAFRVADRDQRLLQQFLEVRLSNVDHVVNVRRPTEGGMAAFPTGRARCPQRSLRSLTEDPVVEVSAEQPELPELIRDVFPDVSHDAVRPDDDLFALVLVLRVRWLRVAVKVLLNGHDPTAGKP